MSGTLLINLLSATATAVLAIVFLVHGRKSQVNQLAFFISFFLAFWAFSSTMTDIARDSVWSLFWARTALVGPVFFAASFLVFSYVFPNNENGISKLKAFLIFLPPLLVCPFLYSELNVINVSLEEWGTDFRPGILYSIGMPYGFLYLLWGIKNLYVRYRKEKDRLHREQALLVATASTFVTVSLIFTNVMLPVVFGYTKAGVFGASSSLVFVILMSYAVFAKGALVPKVIATELFAYVLFYLTAAQMLVSDDLTELLKNAMILVLVAFVTYRIAQSVRLEVRRREEVQTLAKQLELSNASLEQANAHLKEVDERKDEFISIASHQLRTPVAVMKGYISLIQEGAYGPVPDNMKDKVDNMMLMNERLVQMIDNMLNVTRIEKNRIEYTCAMVDVRPVLDQIVEQLQSKAATKGLSVSLGQVANGPLVAYADYEKLIEILTNLVDNSIKYSAFGSIIISAATDSKRKCVVVAVTDHGYGMDQETTQRVFQKFYRSNTPEVMVQGGTGLGLYVCAMFVRGMGGDIWIEHSAPNEGTTIAFALPIEPGGQCKAPEAKTSPPVLPHQNDVPGKN